MAIWGNLTALGYKMIQMLDMLGPVAKSQRGAAGTGPQVWQSNMKVAKKINKRVTLDYTMTILYYTILYYTITILLLLLYYYYTITILYWTVLLLLLLLLLLLYYTILLHTITILYYTILYYTMILRHIEFPTTLSSVQKHNDDYRLKLRKSTVSRTVSSLSVKQVWHRASESHDILKLPTPIDVPASSWWREVKAFESRNASDAAAWLINK